MNASSRRDGQFDWRIGFTFGGIAIAIVVMFLASLRLQANRPS